MMIMLLLTTLAGFFFKSLCYFILHSYLTRFIGFIMFTYFFLPMDLEFNLCFKFCLLDYMLVYCIEWSNFITVDSLLIRV